jgi:hypothetical protein
MVSILQHLIRYAENSQRPDTRKLYRVSCIKTGKLRAHQGHEKKKTINMMAFLFSLFHFILRGLGIFGLDKGNL